MTLWAHGAIVADDAAVLRADDHGVVVGDGVFETLEVRDGRPFALTRHLRRLRASASGLGLDYDEADVRAGIAAVLADPPARARLRVTVTGGPSPYGSHRGDAAPTILVATAAMSDWPPTADVVVVPWTRNERSPTAGLKTTSYADNVVALRWAHDRDATEALFTNTRDEVCEGTGSNVFYENAGRLVTPPLTTGCLGGITRELLIEWLREEGVEVREQPQPVEAMRRAGEAFLASSTRRVQSIRKLDGIAYADAPGPLTMQAMDVFARRAAADPDP